MAESQMLDEFYEVVVHHLPPEDLVGAWGTSSEDRQSHRAPRDLVCAGDRRSLARRSAGDGVLGGNGEDSTAGSGGTGNYGNKSTWTCSATTGN